MRITGGEAVARMIAAHSEGPIFGIGGFQLLPLYDAYLRLGVRHHLVNDERTGIFAADAYARVTNRPGVCDATLGPGATNLVTGLVEALNAGIPIVAIIGGANRRYAGRNMTQESPQLSVLRPTAKDVIRIEIGERIPELLRRAFSLATAARCGPVVVELPEDISHGQFDYEHDEFWAYDVRVPITRTRPDANAVMAACEALRHAERPVILAGGGVHLSGAWDELGDFATRFGVPVAHTMSGKGSISCNHERSIGLAGRYSGVANDIIESADCVFVLGSRLGEIATKRYEMPRPNSFLVQADVSPEDIGRWRRADVILQGDAQATISDLACEMSGSVYIPTSRIPYLREIQSRKEQWRQEKELMLSGDASPMNVGRMIGGMNRILPPDSIVVADGGFASHWSALYYETKVPGRTFIADRGFASIGYGLPGGLGVSLAELGRPVIAVTGDGGINMSLGELETAARCRAQLIVVVINNAASGYVKALQHSLYGDGRYQSSDLMELDYASIARGMGWVGLRSEAGDAFDLALMEALTVEDGPVLIDVVTTRDPGSMLPGTDSRTTK